MSSYRDIGAFVAGVLAEGDHHYRDLPWRRTREPYAVLVSEVMLQQTQVSRVVPYFERWMREFPTLEDLAAAPMEAALRAWQGLGYNRRAIALKRAAEQVASAPRPDGAAAQLPDDEGALLALPGVGPATAAGVIAFAFGRQATYLETNVRAVFLHELFADAASVPDRVLLPYVREAAEEAERRGVGAARWNYALLDYGAHLKRCVPNPSRRSAHHSKQSTFAGSSRQKRAWLLRAVLAESGCSLDDYTAALAEHERSAGRPAPRGGEVLVLLESLVADGALVRDGDRFRLA